MFSVAERIGPLPCNPKGQSAAATWRRRNMAARLIVCYRPGSMMDTQLDPSQADPAAAARVPKTVPGRECGTCMLCCKVMAIDELGKQPGVWCPNCKRGLGCRIYDTRPEECRTFFCHWMLEKNLPAEWKPERAKFVLVMNRGGHITAFVDIGFPGAWRNAPYLETLRRWSLEGTRATPARIVMVRVGTRGIVILPDREVDVGTVGPNQAIRLDGRPDGHIEVVKYARTDA
jgi:hypothetical protein